jgi:hypothetical protein
MKKKSVGTGLLYSRPEFDSRLGTTGMLFPNVADPEQDPERPETFGRIRIRFGTEINVSDKDSNPDSNLDPKLDPKKNL